MLADIDVLGAFVPMLAVWFVSSLALFVAADAVLTRLGFYRLFWHAPVVRCGLFACLFCGGGLAFELS